MKKMLLMCLVPVFLICAWLSAGCRSDNDTEDEMVDFFYEPKDSDRLTEEEMLSLIHHARIFLDRSSKLRLTEEQKKIIQEEMPDAYVRYYGEKFGRLDLFWNLSYKKVLQLTARGHFNQQKLEWHVQIKSILTSDPYTGDYWKPGDNLQLPPKENMQ